MHYKYELRTYSKVIWKQGIVQVISYQRFGGTS